VYPNGVQLFALSEVFCILFVCKHKISRIVGGSEYAEFLETMTALVHVFLGADQLSVLWGAFRLTRYSAWNFTGGRRHADF